MYSIKVVVVIREYHKPITLKFNIQSIEKTEIEESWKKIRR